MGESARERERKKAKLAGKGEGRRVEGSVEAISGQGRVPCSLCALCGASSCDDRGVDLPTPKELGTRPSSSASSPVSSPVRVTLKPGAVAPPLSPGGGCSLLLIRPRRDCVIRHRSIYFRSILLKAEHELDAVDLAEALGWRSLRDGRSVGSVVVHAAHALRQQHARAPAALCTPAIHRLAH